MEHQLVDRRCLVLDLPINTNMCLLDSGDTNKLLELLCIIHVAYNSHIRFQHDIVFL